MFERARHAARLAATAAFFLGCGATGGTIPEAGPMARAGSDSTGGPAAAVRSGTSERPASQESVASGGRNADRHLDAPYVILISFDGFRHDYLDAVETPAFDRVIRRGARAASLIPVFPTKTFPNHYTLATGMYPARHGLVDNVFWDPGRGERYDLRDRRTVEDGSWYGGEPIWITAETQGMVSAAYFWVGTEADVAGIRPTFWYRYDAGVGRQARVEQVLEWLRLPARERPHLILLYFSDVDSEAHAHGPESREARAAVRRVDAALDRLLDGLEKLPIADRVHVVLVSDHGMAAVDPEKTYALSEHVDLEGVRTEGGGPYVSLHFGGDEARAEAVRRTLAGALPHAAVLRIDETPARWRYRDNPRLGDLLVLGEMPWLVVTSSRARAAGLPRGHHGWDPARDRMHGIFLAAGPAIREGVLVPSVESIHVYPLVAHLLGLEPNPEADGRLSELEAILR